MGRESKNTGGRVWKNLSFLLVFFSQFQKSLNSTKIQNEALFFFTYLAFVWRSHYSWLIRTKFAVVNNRRVWSATRVGPIWCICIILHWAVAKISYFIIEFFFPNLRLISKIQKVFSEQVTYANSEHFRFVASCRPLTFARNDKHHNYVVLWIL